MRVISLSTLRDFWIKHPETEQPLKAWYDEVKKANWQDMHAIKQQYRSASILKNHRVIFNIKGNKYRLVVSFWFTGQTAYIKFVGTHSEYDAINSETIE